MEYRKLGNSELYVSPLCLGTMTFSDGADETMCNKIYSQSRDKGINFFDCANVYAGGESEKILGKLIHNHRKDVIITTKAFYPMGKESEVRGLSNQHLTKALDESLKRLNTDYIDIYYLHSFDKETPLYESLSTLNDFVKQGKIRNIGVSNFAAWQVMKTIAITDKFNYAPVVCIQPMYNLLKRQCESEILPMAKSESIGVVPYGPLAGGLLTGKYQAENKPKEGRFNTNKMYQKRYDGNETNKTIQKFIEFSRNNNFNPVSLAIAWVNSNETITSPIIGARNVEQLKPALDSLHIDISNNLRQKISSFTLKPVSATDRKEELS